MRRLISRLRSKLLLLYAQAYQAVYHFRLRLVAPLTAAEWASVRGTSLEKFYHRGIITDREVALCVRDPRHPRNPRYRSND